VDWGGGLKWGELGYEFENEIEMKGIDKRYCSYVKNYLF
jgi:hypothetical protein